MAKKQGKGRGSRQKTEHKQDEGSTSETDAETDRFNSHRERKPSSNGKTGSWRGHPWLVNGLQATVVAVAVAVCSAIVYQGVMYVSDSDAFDFDIQKAPWGNASTAAQEWFGNLNLDNAPEWLRRIGNSNATAYDRKPDRLGLSLARKGLRAKYPVVLVPGFVTSGLELWAGHECFKGALPLLHRGCALVAGQRRGLAWRLPG
jgi:hypothetical protein